MGSLGCGFSVLPIRRLVPGPVKKLFERSQVGPFQFVRVGIVLETNRIPVHYGTGRYEAER
jgi:hypothetical protein